MKKTVFLISVILTSTVSAAEFKVSSTEPVVVSTPAQWQLSKAKPPTNTIRFETYQISPPDGRNVTCLISLLAKKRQEFADPEFLKTLLRTDSRPYVNFPEELSKINIKELKITGGIAFYANFVDPDLVGKPVPKGDYKTATPVIISLGAKYLIKVTVLCDEINGTDYREALKIIESIKEKNQEA